MKEIKKVLKNRLAQKNLSKLSIWSFLMHHINAKSISKEEIKGFIRWEVLTFRLPSNEDKTMWFMQREDLRKELNIKLDEFWYSYRLRSIKIY